MIALLEGYRAPSQSHSLNNCTALSQSQLDDKGIITWKRIIQNIRKDHHWNLFTKQLYSPTWIYFAEQVILLCIQTTLYIFFFIKSCTTCNFLEVGPVNCLVVVHPMYTLSINCHTTWFFYWKLTMRCGGLPCFPVFLFCSKTSSLLFPLIFFAWD